MTKESKTARDPGPDLAERAAARRCQWVFASLQTEPLQSTSVRAQIRGSLALAGAPQLLLELGVVRASRPTARRPVAELTADR